MSGKVWTLSKAFSTFMTFIRFFSSVSPLVDSEGYTLTEAFPTDRTSIRPLPSVDSLVFIEIRAPFEALLTFFTCIALLPFMYSLMSKTVRNMAGFPTFVTYIVFLSYVDSLVPIEV